MGALPSVKYAPSTDIRSGNQRMMIKVRHAYCQLYAHVKGGTQLDIMEETHCKKYPWGPKIINYISVS